MLLLVTVPSVVLLVVLYVLLVTLPPPPPEWANELKDIQEPLSFLYWINPALLRKPNPCSPETSSPKLI